MDRYVHKKRKSLGVVEVISYLCRRTRKIDHPMTQIRLFVTLLFLTSMLFAHGQLADPREKFSITADVDGATNTDYYWKSEKGERLEEGRLQHGVAARVRASLRVLGNQQFSLSVSPFYRYSNKELNASDTYGALLFDVPREHHHYGSSLMANYNTRWLGKPFTLMAMGTANFSQYGFEDASSMIGGIFSITRNQKTFLGLGLICLVGTSVSWPLYPMFIYTHQFNNHWSISCMEVNNYLNYQVSRPLRLSFGMEMESDKIYLRPKVTDYPEKMEISQVTERFGIFTNIQTSRELSINLGVGAAVPFYGRLRQSGHNKTYMNLHDQVKPFVRLRVKYTISQQPTMARSR